MKKKEIKKKYKSYLESLKKYNLYYFDKSDPLVSDSDYDKLKSNIFKLEKKFKKFIVEKGSISINGVSLTISKVKANTFEITIIPHTLKLTNLINLKRGDKVNVEFDMVGKYLNNIYN